MQRSSRKAWLVLWLGLFGCSLATDFDRDKIAELDGGGGPGDGSIGQMDARPDGTVMADAQPDGDSNVEPQPDGAPPTDTGVVTDTGPGAQCTNHSQCPANQLCCSGLCVNTSVATQCSECGQACNADSANTCTNRQCGCDNAAACGGNTPYCVANNAGVSACVECGDNTACEGRTDGKTLCIGNRCSACDPKDNSGCMGNTPICDPSSRTCVKCTMGANDNCGGNTVCTASGACGGCDDATDCATPTAPICDMTVAVCRACGTNNECATQMPSRPLCSTDGRCGVCKTVANAPDTGCAIDSATPSCRLNGASQYECQACNNNNQCDTGGTRRLCSGGRCVQCTATSPCTDPTKPVCDNGLCRACAVATEATDCGGNTPACTALGMCGVCRPGGPNACSGSVNTTCSLLNTCVDCLGSEGCAAGQQCRPGIGGLASACVDCINNDGCMGAAGQCDTQANVCAPCLVGTNAGCMPGKTCVAGNTPAMNKCVACTPTVACPAMPCKTAACMNGECMYTNVSVTDNVDCTDDACANGVITHTPNNANCTNVDTKACTVPTCSPATAGNASGCIEVPNLAMCDDGLTCTTGDACVGAGGDAMGCGPIMDMCTAPQTCAGPAPGACGP